VGLALSLIDHEDYHHFKIIEKKNKLRLEREHVAEFEVDETVAEELAAAFLADEKPIAPPAGTGKKKAKKKAEQARKNKPPVNTDIWSNH